MPNIPTDPLIDDQWHLTRLGDLEAIWADYDGSGVHVGIYDTNIELDHPDLAANYDPTRVVSYNGATPSDDINPGAPVGDDQNHGTSVAGLIAGAANAIGGVGVAFGSTFTGVAIFDSISPFYVNAAEANKDGFYAALRSLNFDVVNNSWGSSPGFSDYQNLAVAGQEAAKIADAWHYVAVNRRGGLGTIVVKAAGNDAANAEGSGTNSVREIITVAAVSNLGTVSSYSNHGVNILVSGLGSENPSVEGGLGIVTTDRTGTAGYNTRADPSGAHDYTDDFGGTSAATPIVSGVVSLMLDANAGLGWRDVQNILAASADHVGSAIGATTPENYEEGNWQINDAANWNGGGMHYDIDYGYGVVNAYNAVRMAEVWALFGPAKTSANETSTTVSGTLDKPIEDFDGTTLKPVTFSFDVTNDVQIENLQLTLDITHTFYADLSVRLTAPDGTVYVLDDNTGGGDATSYTAWTYGVNALRGQSSVGTWTVTVTDEFNLDSGNLNGFSATFYGSAPSADNVYTFTDEFLSMAALDGSRTLISDTNGGTDWLNLAAVAGKQFIDLANEGGWSTVDGTHWFQIAAGTQIENVVTGDGDDNVLGSGGANTIYGMRGDDFLAGLGGNDILDGGAGDDMLEGGAGDDVMRGGDGVDTVYYTGATAGVTVSLAITTQQNTGGWGKDTLSGIEWIAGSGYADTLTGNASDNLLEGNDGNDRLYGGAGFDQLYGDAGDDTLYSNADGDVLSGGAGSDTVSYANVASGVTVSLAEATHAGVGNDQFSSIENLTGTNLADTLTGDGNANILRGSGGDDTLDGGAGTDQMIGGTGNDIFYVDNAGDQVLEADGEGTDLVYSSVTFSLAGQYVENLTLTGTADINATGNGLANVLTGNSGANILNGGAGADTMSGGLGNDRYVVDNAGDVVIEGDSSGNDTVESSVSYTLTANIETLKLTGSGAINGTGNGQANTLMGNSAANTLDGGAGADLMVGGKGDDIYWVDNAGEVVTEADGDGSDTINASVSYSLAGQYVEVLNLLDGAVNGTGNSLANRIVGNAAANTLTGGAGNDRLDGGAGADKLIGGLGNDVYVVDQTGDKIVENDGEGTDTVEAYFSYSLAGQYIEILKLLGTGDFNGNGNSLANTLYGNSGANVLNGAAGADTMYGGAGNDTYIVDNVGDRVFENNGEGTDTVQSSVTFSINGQYIEALTLTGTAAINGTGNSLANTLTGNGAANVLNGLAGDDKLHGGLGSDTLTGGAGADSFWFETALGATNVDNITDFSVADDTIYLDRTIFSGIAANGALNPNAFWQGSAAHDADDRIVYDKAAGNIWYDADGSGAGAAVLFAHVTANTALTAADFFAVP